MKLNITTTNRARRDRTRDEIPKTSQVKLDFSMDNVLGRHLVNITKDDINLYSIDQMCEYLVQRTIPIPRDDFVWYDGSGKSIAKRLRLYLYKSGLMDQASLSNKETWLNNVFASIGQISSFYENVQEGAYAVEMVKGPFEFRPGTMGDSPDSCWFEKNGGIRQYSYVGTFENAGGWCLLFYHNNKFNAPNGRLWVYPDYDLGMFAAFNRYHIESKIFNIEPLVLAKLTGGGIKKVHGETNLHINSSDVFLIGSVANLKKYRKLKYKKIF